MRTVFLPAFIFILLFVEVRAHADDAPPAHAPLSKPLVDLIRLAVAQNQFDFREYAGLGESKARRDPGPVPGILIGLDLTFRPSNGESYIGAVRPVYLTATGKQDGPWYGTPQGAVTHAEAPPEHTVMSMKVYYNEQAGFAVTGIRIDYQKYDDAGLLPPGLSSAVYGTENNDGFRTIPRHPKRGFIIGLTGSISSSTRGGSMPGILDGLGVIVIPRPTPNLGAAAPAAAPPRPNQPDPALVNKPASTNVPSDRVARHPPLPAALADYLQNAVASRQTTDIGGTAGRSAVEAATFRTIPADGGLLIGFDLTYGHFINTPVVQAVRPIFLTRKGKVAGPAAGVGGVGGVHVEAKPGYAIGRIYTKAGQFLNSITITYMKITPTGLDPNDSYEGACYGSAGGTGRAMIGGDGTLIVGLTGRAEPQGGLTRLGAVTVSPMPAK